ncbi:hypothetical protein BWQ96_05640 [Gracilariopsis chorda]|uniref:No apical meristem-associated C-terminal domain-containing protein n=1 Tax=Gracilariopsis chorda TaxID=448386 RepID=A0A2V3IR86_9FLOR|nr:hypothetical protein BWQ96_05640 [Gracilariopsis chorda]|eukprot:PXF44609.1 hypothetical protein BWQ96_05640 [Gracilariopsis chorda]
MESKGAVTTEYSSSGRPLGRHKATEKLSKQEATGKKLKIAAKAVELQRQRNAALDRQNEILLFSNASKGVNEDETLEYFRLGRQEAIVNARRRQKELEKERQYPGSNGISSVLATQGTADQNIAFTTPPDVNRNNSGAAPNSNSRQFPVFPSMNEGSVSSQRASDMTSQSVRFTGEVTETNDVGETRHKSDISGGIMFPGEVTETGN